MEWCVCVEMMCDLVFFFFSSRRRHTRYIGDWSSDVCSSDLRPWSSRLAERVAFRADARACQARHHVEGVKVCGSKSRRALRRFARLRSEERRVGKECRAGWAPYRERKNR